PCGRRRARGLFPGRVAPDEDLRSLAARPGEPDRRPCDRDRVRLDDGRPLRLRRRGRPLSEPAHRPRERLGDGHMALKIAEIPEIDVDPVTLDIIEGALKSTRFEMDATLFRTAMS